MNLPAEREDDEEERPEAEPETEETAPERPLEEPSLDEPSAGAESIAINYEYRKTALPGLRERLGSLPILRDDLFLAILALTVLNAVIFLHYQMTPQHAQNLREANQSLKAELKRDSDFLSPVYDFINVHGDFNNPENSEFETSLARFRGRLSKLGVETLDLFFYDEFLQKNGGLYWSKKSERAPTVYQPVTP